VDLSRDYFELFQLPRVFDVETSLLAERYRALQQQVHPDRFAGATDQEQRLAMQYATYVNEAYATLRAPLARAIYMLDLAGRDIRENPALDPAFLMEQIELREDLEALEAKGQGTEAEADAERFMARLDDGIAALEVEFSGAMSGAALEGGDTALDAAEQSVYKLQFLHKLRAEASAVEERLLGY
tara:strand:+ start:1649 stop:2203 length:555 start_codon:yes stop_codon:yes gene_type:complete